MATVLSRLVIEQLHGRPNVIDVPIVDNKLVLVGENGLGKSTVVNLLYYVLTQQWRRLGEYKFEAVQVEASGDLIRLTHADVERLAERQGAHLSSELRMRYPASIARRFYSFVASDRFVDLEDEKLVHEFSDQENIPISIAREIFRLASDSPDAKLKKPLAAELKKLAGWKFGQFLYLPTYRRIEQDLKSIFRGIEIEEKVREFRDRFRKREKSSFIELVEFGMEDVERTIQSRMSQIKESVRTGLSTLTGTYLREVIRGLQDNPDISILRAMQPASFESMFARIEEQILPSADKKLLQSKIAEFGSGAPVGPDDKVIAHFLSKLAALYRQQQQNESDVRDFVSLCNIYLTGKRVVYDDLKYEIYISQAESGERARKAEKLELKMLSSGEKQIVSLFSHIYFSGENQYFVVIDEPELSLSVPWQQRFLPDILSTGRCTGIVAVTHSPFIWENDLDPYVRSLAECVRGRDVAH